MWLEGGIHVNKLLQGGGDFGSLNRTPSSATLESFERADAGTVCDHSVDYLDTVRAKRDDVAV